MVSAAQWRVGAQEPGQARHGLSNSGQAGRSQRRSGWGDLTDGRASVVCLHPTRFPPPPITPCDQQGWGNTIQRSAPRASSCPHNLSLRRVSVVGRADDNSRSCDGLAAMAGVSRAKLMLWGRRALWLQSVASLACGAMEATHSAAVGTACTPERAWCGAASRHLDAYPALRPTGGPPQVGGFGRSMTCVARLISALRTSKAAATAVPSGHGDAMRCGCEQKAGACLQ